MSHQVSEDYHIPHQHHDVEHEYHSSSSSSVGATHEKERYDDHEQQQQQHHHHHHQHHDNQEENELNRPSHDTVTSVKDNTHQHHHSREASKDICQENERKEEAKVNEAGKESAEDAHVEEVHEKSNEPTPCNLEDENYVNTKKEETSAENVNEHHDHNANATEAHLQHEEKHEKEEGEGKKNNTASEAVKKPRAKKEKKNASTRVVNINNVFSVAAIPEGINSPRSLKLCAKHKINPRELSRHTIEDFMGPNVPTELADLRHRSYVKRQNEHMRVLQEEYNELLKKDEAEKASAEAEESHYNDRKATIEKEFRQRKIREMIEAGIKAHKPIKHESKHNEGNKEGSNMHTKHKKGVYRAQDDENLSRAKQIREQINRDKLEKQVNMLHFKDYDILSKIDEHYEAQHVFAALHQKNYLKDKNLHYTEELTIAENAVHESIRRYKSPKRAGDPNVLHHAFEEYSTPRSQRRSPSREQAENEKPQESC